MTRTLPKPGVRIQSVGGVSRNRLDTGEGARFAGPVAEISLLRRCELIALRPDVRRSELERMCAEARRRECQAVAVPGSRVALAVHCLEESPVKVAALVGFPFGAGDTEAKRFEVDAAVDAGAQEVQAVVNLGWLKDGDDRAFLRELRDLREASEERPLTMIIEFGLLTAEEVRRAASLALEAEVQFLATATGCAVRPTTVEDVRLLRDAVGPELGLTAVGGIQGPADAEALVAAGANRFGVFTLDAFPPPD